MENDNLSLYWLSGTKLFLTKLHWHLLDILHIAEEWLMYSITPIHNNLQTKDSGDRMESWFRGAYIGNPHPSRTTWKMEMQLPAFWWIWSCYQIENYLSIFFILLEPAQSAITDYHYVLVDWMNPAARCAGNWFCQSNVLGLIHRGLTLETSFNWLWRNGKSVGLVDQSCANISTAANDFLFQVRGAGPQPPSFLASQLWWRQWARLLVQLHVILYLALQTKPFWAALLRTGTLCF